AYIGGVYGKQPTGAPPTLQEISAYVSGMSEPKVKMIMAHPAFKKACEARGIAVGKRPGITAKQDLALSVILDPTAGISLRQRLKKAGVPMATYRAWLRNPQFRAYVDQLGDRKSTRLNSSHVKISYAVFCLKKKNIKR